MLKVCKRLLTSYHLLVLVLLVVYSNFYAQSKLTNVQIDSLINIGKKELNNKEWGNVLSIFDKVLDADPLNLYANYYYAVAQREKSLTADPISRIFRWNSAENHFKNVIKLDSTFKDVFYQYALLQLYKKNYFEALDLVRRQLKTKSNINEIREGVFYLYDVVLHNEDKDNLGKWLSNPKSDFDMYCLGELYRNTNHLDKAKEIFDSVIAQRDISLIPAYLSLVKLYLQEENPQKAAEIYWNAVNSVSDTVEGNLLLNDLVFLFNEKDYSVFKTLKTADDIKQFIKSFWFGRNPYPSMPYNLYLTEYYKRIIYAEKNFWYDGLRLTIYDPNKLDVINYPLWYLLNKKYNDQGIIYLRFGQPDEISNPASSSSSDVISWLYNATPKTSKMIFHFEKNFNAPANYWKLVPGFTDKFINERLAVWDSRYHDLDPNSNTFSDILKEGVKSIETVLTTDKFNWPEDLKFLDAYYSVSQFKDVSYLSFLVLSFAVPMLELSKEFEKKDSLNFESAITIYDASVNPVFHMVKNYRNENALSVNVYDSLFIDKYEIPLKAGLYFVCFDIYLPNQKKVFAIKFKQELKNFEDGKFQCSSLEPAFEIFSNKDPLIRDRKFLKIIPNPSKKFNSQKNVYIYYEIYNLKKSSDNLSKYTIEVNIERKESGNFIWNFISGIFSSKKYSLSIKDSYMDTSTNVANFQAFDMSRLEPGEYVIRLDIKDDNSGEITSAFSEFALE